MPGNHIGGLKAAKKVKERFSQDVISAWGAKGGSVKCPKGFACMPKEKVRAAGRLGGQISKRGKARTT